MTPGNNYLMLQPIDTAEKETASGIVYQTRNQQDDSPTKKGVVVKLGARVNSTMITGREIQTGQTVNYFPESGTEITYRGDKIVLVHINGVVTID